MKSGLIHVGFWKDTRMPLSNLFNKYPDPRDLAQPGWYEGTEEVIGKYLDSGKRVEQYLGYSYCRFECGERNMGTADLSDGVYLWPEGLSHYVRVHSVVLPREFLTHVLKRIALGAQAP